MVYVYDFPKPGDVLNDDLGVFVDTDFAGCTCTRRSTSGGVLMMGPHVLTHPFIRGSIVGWNR